MNFINSSIKTTLFTLMGGLLLLTACGEGEPETKPAVQSVPVSVAKAEAKPFTQTETYPGTIKSPNQAMISTKVMSKINRIHVEVGDYVRKGAKLVTIDNADLLAQKKQVEANLVEANSNLKNVQTNFDRFTTLYEQGSATKKELDDITMQQEVVNARITALNAKLSELDEILSYTNITAPFNGFVTAKNASEGDLSAPGQPILTFEQTGAKEISVNIPESKLNLFTVDDTTEVYIPVLDETVQAVITNISAGGNRASRQFAAVLSLINADDRVDIKSGMFVEVAIAAETTPSIIVPNSALIERGQLKGVYTLTDNNQLVLRWIRTGRTFGDQTEIISGLKQNEAFVLQPSPTLVEGQPVTIQ